MKIGIINYYESFILHIIFRTNKFRLVYCFTKPSIGIAFCNFGIHISIYKLGFALTWDGR
jgi:hypothetical protein